ncbi:hypothetical protein [Pseudoalteromonas phage PH357]|nr:hypothetical protein [Pseudoalteromonas phage PH357]
MNGYEVLVSNLIELGATPNTAKSVYDYVDINSTVGVACEIEGITIEVTDLWEDIEEGEASDYGDGNRCYQGLKGRVFKTDTLEGIDEFSFEINWVNYEDDYTDGEWQCY